ncbi:Protein fem-1 like protein A [Dufourea novaeangliae]|uniref:Protein fem-1 like protein A n=1 Tax=Dufourea novaeangliae TaxID=178035 RepID=A0A154PB35_DUFNO|nr:Protein fem-1 like protein A [Dufourea novaeangliae]
MKDDCAPLFIACKRGTVAIVEYLISVCHANIEQKGKYEIPNDPSVHYVTPLWCAAISGKLPVMKCLIFHGSDVNAVSDSGSTPVRSACFTTQIDIVSYLVENGANIHKASYNGGTCLINSVQSVELCTFLVENGADVNATDIQNKTALHFAIQEHRLETTKFLCENNADLHIRSRYNDDALQTACLEGADKIFTYLVNKISYSPERLADATELMGSTFFNDYDDVEMALKYWRSALAIRNANVVDGVPLPKRPVLPKRDTHENATEFTTLEELNAIQFNFDALATQSLLICERILDVLRYQRCIDLWRRTLEIRVEKDSILYIDTCSIAESLLKLMIDFKEKTSERRNRNKEEPRFSDVVAIFKLLVSQLTEAKELLQIQPVYKLHQDSYNGIIKCITHLIYLLVETGKLDDQKAITRQLVYDLIKQNPRTAVLKDTILHLCVSEQNTIETTYIYTSRTHIIFPHLGVVKLLLECGANVNAMNIKRTTPLHIASSRFNFENSLIKLLLDYGAHIDVVDRTGETPIQMIVSNSAIKMNLANYMSLKCWAARAILKCGIQWTELPVSLHQFVQFHKKS